MEGKYYFRNVRRCAVNVMDGKSETYPRPIAMQGLVLWTIVEALSIRMQLCSKRRASGTE